MKSSTKTILDQLNNIFNQPRDRFGLDTKEKLTTITHDFNELDQEIKQKEQLLVQKDGVINQKTAEVRSKDSLLVQKEREEFIEVLQKLDYSYTDHIGDWPNNDYKDAVINGNLKLISDSLPTLKQMLLTKEFINVLNKINPEIYKTDIVSLNSNQFSSAVSNWPDNIYKKAIIENNVEGIKLIIDSLPTLKGRYLLKNEFIAVLHKLYPELYPQNFEDWSASRGKELIDNEDYATINSILPNYRQELNKMLDIQKEVELEKLKEVIVFKEIEIQNKNQLLLAKELENQKLLIQKEEEIHNKSLVKNQVINELQDNIGLKEKEALNLKIESLMKQVEFHKKESELKDKVLEDIRLIDELKAKEVQDASHIHRLKAKQLDNLIVIHELKEQVLSLETLYNKGQGIIGIELDDLKHKVNESIASEKIDEMKEFSKYLSQLMKNPIEKEESLDISELLNLSPIVHTEENVIQNPLAVINNFDINHINTTHSIYPSGGGSSFDIIDAENLN